MVQRGLKQKRSNGRSSTSKVRDILVRNRAGESYREIHASYREISYPRIAEIARLSRRRAPSSMLSCAQSGGAAWRVCVAPIHLRTGAIQREARTVACLARHCVRSMCSSRTGLRRLGC